jgi:hypothetical protein
VIHGARSGALIAFFFVTPVGTIHHEAQSHIAAVVGVLPHGNNKHTRTRAQRVVPVHIATVTGGMQNTGAFDISRG